MKLTALLATYLLRRALYEELLSKGVLTPLTATIEGQRDANDPTCKHYVAPAGTSSVVRHFLAQSGAEVAYSRRVSSLRPSQANRWTARAEVSVT